MTFTEALFPPADRVLYAHAPLTQVICQIRFPSILRIESQAPADFQDRIRSTFPGFEQIQGPGGQQIPPQIVQMLGLQGSGMSYNFKTEDDAYMVSLSGSFISLTCNAYDRWEDFESNLSLVMNAFVDIYKPSFYSRIGLRYINVIDRDGLKLSDVPWSELLRPELVGTLSMPQWEARAIEARSNVRVHMSNDEGTIFLQHGLNKIDGVNALSYVIDFDFYRDKKTEVGNAAEVLGKFHERSGRAFAWCIRDRLRDALGPRKPDD